ncbi:MAG TPA: polysaccharide deacetylase family protein [Solirubrobacteraceae bacterium]|nr:polysaccharide deacetylase family protein [Solirubrobacteraceae bacterium]
MSISFAIIPRVLQQLLAPVNADAARAVGLPRTLPEAAGIALTFDDGPHPEGTPAMLGVLARAGHRATFFVIGEQVRRRPELAREIAARGHLIALHGDRHRLQLRLTAAQLREDLKRGRATIEDATGVAVALHRPPYGIYSPAGLEEVRTAGMEPLLWSRWGKDWRRLTTPERIAARASRDLAPGDVILLHDADFYNARNSHRRTAQALELIVSELAAREIGTVLPV